MRLMSEYSGQRNSEGCSIIRTRPNGIPDTFEFSLDMDHLLSCCLPVRSISLNVPIAKDNVALKQGYKVNM